MLPLDLLILVALLLVIGATDVLRHERLFILALSGYFALQGLLWLVHIVWLKRDGATVFSLPHWGVWLICAGLLLLGA